MVNRWEGSRTLDTDTACYQDITVEAAHHSWTSSAWFYSTSLQDGDQSTHQSTSDRRTSQYSGLDEPPSDHGHPPPAPPLQSGHQVKTDSPVLTLSPIEIPVKIQIKVLVWFRSWYLREILWYSQVFQSDRNGNKITWDDLNFRTLLHQQF